jgi:hypothetical protein
VEEFLSIQSQGNLAIKIVNTHNFGPSNSSSRNLSYVLFFHIYGGNRRCFVFFFFWWDGFELRASHLCSRHSILPAHFSLVILEMWVSQIICSDKF